MRFAFQNALCLPILSRWAVSTCGQQAGWQSVRGLGGYRRGGLSGLWALLRRQALQSTESNRFPN